MKYTAAITLATLCTLLALAQEPDAQPIVRFDFESGSLQDWQVVEGGFGRLLADRDRFHNINEPYNKEGVYFLTTLEDQEGRSHDPYTGILESPVFQLAHPHISFLIGGGQHDNTYAALCTLDGKEIVSARGQNSEIMTRVAWLVPGLVGKKVFLRIVDRNTGSWGHLTFDDFTARGAIDPKATEKRLAAARIDRARQELRSRLANTDPQALRSAIQDLAATYPTRYTQGSDLLHRLDRWEEQWRKIEREIESNSEKALEKCSALAKELTALQREALLANPLIAGHPILFVVRKQYRPDHHNTATMFQTGEVNTNSFEGGSALKTIDFAQGGKTTTLLEAPEGVIRDPEVHFDGDRIIFSKRNEVADDYHIYEIGADGSGLKQLTTAAAVADIDPLYLPDGAIAFSSTREPKYCMCNQHIMCNLFRMDADGANIYQIGKSTLFEGHGFLLPDGRILYDRWEYVDRNFGDAQGLWTVNPDGTNHAVYWGNNTWSPGGVIDARTIPGTQQTICIFGSCHDRPWGAMAIIDRARAIDGPGAVIRTWPTNAAKLVSLGQDRNDYGFDIFKGVNPKFEDPYPLSANYFLCSRMTGQGERMGLYLVDTFGNEVLLHVEGPGCFDPMPLAPRPRPVIIPPRRNFQDKDGTFYVANVYEGTHMQGVEPGAVKALRVVESPEKRFFTMPAWGGQGVHRPGMNWHDFNNKRILGTVPVEADGSAHFTVPSDRFVYFQLLDKEGMMIQSMRSGAMAQSGETTGCIGCHENRRIAPPPASSEMPLALRRAPDLLKGWQGPARQFAYRTEVQPVFDAHCVKCHDFGKKAGEKLLLSGDRTLSFNVSYMELWRKNYIHAVGAGPAQTQPARSWGSHASKLIDVIQKGHKDIKLSPQEFDRIVTWIDINAPYYPEYASSYPGNLAGRSPLTPPELERLEALTSVPFGKLAAFHSSQGPKVTFDRPELSPCLAAIADKASAEYKEALDLIQLGRKRLDENPRPGSPGFTLAGADAQRQDKYTQRQAIEQANRQAIHAGQKHYDE